MVATITTIFTIVTYLVPVITYFLDSCNYTVDVRDLTSYIIYAVTNI